MKTNDKSITLEAKKEKFTAPTVSILMFAVNDTITTSTSPGDDFFGEEDVFDK